VPKDDVIPYESLDEAISSVVHVIVAEVFPGVFEDMLLRSGASVSAATENEIE
jgi:hypothetical protein